MWPACSAMRTWTARSEPSNCARASSRSRAERTAAALPKLASDVDRVNAGLLPPGFLVTGAMHGTMMRATERDDKFIACFAAERARLHKPDVMRIRGLAAAQQAGLLHYKPKMVPV